jgi:hypothetical protein
VDNSGFFRQIKCFEHWLFSAQLFYRPSTEAETEPFASLRTHLAESQQWFEARHFSDRCARNGHDEPALNTTIASSQRAVLSRAQGSFTDRHVYGVAKWSR